MDNRIIALIIVVAIAAVSLNYITPGSILSTGTVQSISSTTLNGQPAYLITMLGTGGADSIVNFISASQFSSTATQGIATDVGKINNKYVYTLTERTGSAKTANTLQLANECYGNSFLNQNICPNTFTIFKNSCLALNPNNIAYDVSPSVITADYRCYTPTAAWVIADFNKVGTYAQPSIYVSVLPYAANTAPIAYVELTAASPSANLVASNGTAIGQVTMTGLQPTFTNAPDTSGIEAVSPPSTPRSFSLVNGGSGGVDSSFSNLQSSYSTCIQNALSSPATGVYDVTKLSSCVNTYNAGVQNLQNNNPVTGTFASVPIDTSAINSNGTITITNSFSIPSLTMWLYKSAVGDNIGVSRANSAPVAVSCQSQTLPAGASGQINAQVTNGVGASGQVIYWSASCGTPVTLPTSSGSVNVAAGTTGSFSIPISTGQVQGTSTCTVTAKTTDLTGSISATCNVQASSPCNVVVPSGCNLKADCSLNCTVPPQTCSDGTAPGNCNANSQRCTSVNGALTLQSDSACASTPVSPTNSSNQSQTSAQCLPYVQTLNTAVIGGVNIPFLGNIGGATVSSCVWNFPMLGIALLVVAAVLMKMGKGEEAKAVGIAGLALIVLSFVADNATLLALGGTGILIIAVVVAAAYLAIKYHLV